MDRERAVRSVVVFCLLFCAAPLVAQQEDPVSLSGLFYLTYLNETGAEEANGFSIGRSYLTARVNVVPRLSGRITLDSHQDMEGDGRGDMKVRLKYAYAKYDFGDISVVRGLGLEGGMVHMVWLDFEEHVNLYRMRDPMFMERSGLFNSADFGVTLTGSLGEPLGEEYRRTVTSHYAARYGSFAVGIYNGGGYHAVEENNDKVVEGRLTLRPVPGILPGLQVSGLAILGKGNEAGDPMNLPDWHTYNLFLSYQHARGTLTAQYVTGKGNQKGTWVSVFDPSQALEYSGFSVFGEGRLGGWRVIAGYDSFDRVPDAADIDSSRIHAGLGYDLGGQNILILDWDRRDFDSAALDSETRYRAVMQLKF